MKGSRKTDVMREFWDRKAEENPMYYVSSYRPYDQQDENEFWEWGRKLAEKFLEESEISFSGEETVLEIGSGIGRMTAYLAERFKLVYGIDVSPNMIDKARENLRELDNVRLDVGNGLDLGIYADEKFDFVFSYLTFQHIPDKKIIMNYIREAGRVLKSGGYFYFQVNNMPETIRARLKAGTRFRALARMLKPGERASGSSMAAKPSDQDHPAWQGSRISLSKIRQACKSGKMNVLRTSGKGTQYLWIKAMKQ